MSPRDLDPDVLATRLSLLRELLEDLETIGPEGAGRITEDRVLRRAVERLLTQVVDVAVDVNSHVAATSLGRTPSDYRDSFRLAATAGLIDGHLAGRLELSVGLRNILVHEYVRADLAIVAAAVPVAAVEYREYLRGAGRWLDERS